MKKILLFISAWLVASSVFSQENYLRFVPIAKTKNVSVHFYSSYIFTAQTWAMGQSIGQFYTSDKGVQSTVDDASKVLFFYDWNENNDLIIQSGTENINEVVSTQSSKTTFNGDKTSIVIQVGDKVSFNNEVLGVCGFFLVISYDDGWNKTLTLDMYISECYEYISNITITNDFVIPEYIDYKNERYKVTEIHEYAFKGLTNLTSVTIPSSVTKVGENAFSGCTALKNVTCLATVPPTAYASSFENYNGYLSIPCESKDDYDFASCWGSFKHVDCIGSETVELTKDEVAVVPEKTEAEFSMPKNENANSYTLTISNNGVTFCTLTFNAQGQLANIDFSTTKSYELKSDVEGFKFTVTGLSTASDYGYSFKALDNAKSVLKEYSGSFTTKNEDGTGGSSQGGSAQGEQGGEQGATTYTVTLALNNNSYGSVMGAGEYAEGAKATLIAIPATGYKFENWNDGNTENPRIITISANVSYVANFEQSSSGDVDYTVTAIPANNEQGTVVGGGVYEPLSTVTLAVVPAKGYQFVSWNDGNTDNPRTITVISNSFYVATFEKTSTGIFDVEESAMTVTIVNGQILVNGEAPAFVVTVSGQKIANANLKAGGYFVVVDGNSVGVVVR